MFTRLFTIVFACLLSLSAFAQAPAQSPADQIWGAVHGYGSEKRGEVTLEQLLRELHRRFHNDQAMLQALSSAVREFVETDFDLSEARRVATLWQTLEPTSPAILPELTKSPVVGMFYAAPTADDTIRFRYQLPRAEATEQGIERISIEVRAQLLEKEGDRVLQGKTFTLTMMPGDEVVESEEALFSIGENQRLRIKIRFYPFGTNNAALSPDFGRPLWWAFRSVTRQGQKTRVPYQLGIDGSVMCSEASMLVSAWADVRSMRELQDLVDEQAQRDVSLQERFVGRPPPELVLQRWPTDLTPANAIDTAGVFKLPLGQVVVLDFWVDWCGPCKRAMPTLSTTYTQRRSAGLEMIAVCDGSERRNYDDVRSFVAEKALSQRMALATPATATNFDVRSWPMIWVIDRQGKVRGVWAYPDDAAVQRCIEECLREPI